MKALKIDERKRAVAIDAAQINWDQQMRLFGLRNAIDRAKVLESKVALAANKFKEALEAVAQLCPVQVGNLYHYTSLMGRSVTIKVSRVNARLDTREWRVSGRKPKSITTLTTSIPFPKFTEEQA